MLSRRAYLAATFGNTVNQALRCLLQRIARTADSFHAALFREGLTSTRHYRSPMWRCCSDTRSTARLPGRFGSRTECRHSKCATKCRVRCLGP